tara:strand:+ start:986 stop:1744 length:759 start_codon:yes stop_codon:yes gene_type:complete
MAGDWIKLEHATPDKPEVVAIADALGMDDHDLAWAKCVRLWIWLDQQSVDGNGVSVTDSFIDRFTRVTGFSKALRKVGWLDGRDGRLSVPNFERHNGKSAKTRANTAKRVQKTREKCNARSVTEALPEKRREEKIKPTPSPTRAKTKSTSKKPKLPSGGDRELAEPQPHPEWADQWACWVDSWEGREERKFDEIKAQHQLGQLLSRDPAKALRDLEFSLNRWSKRILDSDDDWDIKNAKSPRVSGKKCDLDI